MAIVLFNVTFTPTALVLQYQWTFDGLFHNENRTNGTPFTYQADNSDPDNIKTHPISLITSNANGNCVSQPVTKTLTVYPMLYLKQVFIAVCLPRFTY